jgi:RNA polymerase sigma factor (sigma-70 family)
MAFQEEVLRAEIEKVFQSLSEQKGIELTAELLQVLWRNLEKGRVQTFVEDDLTRVYEYVEIVAEKYTRTAPFIRELQVERATTVWAPLLKQMQMWAYNYFIRKGFYKSISTQEIASECVNEAALALANACFPYDIDFGSWAHVIVQNACLKYMRNEMKKSIVPPRNIVELDERLSTMVDPVKENQRHQDDQDELLDAIARLSKARRQVIELFYFEGLSLPEIAKKLNKTANAVYSLHFNALNDLRKILDANRNNL